MFYQNLYYIIIVLLFLGILYCFSRMNFIVKKRRSQQLRFKKDRYKDFIDHIKKGIDEEEINKLFLKTGIKATAQYYQLIRYVLFIVFLIAIIVTSIIKKSVLVDLQILFIVLLFICTTPKKKILGIKTPFYFFMDLLSQGYRAKIELEIYRTMSQLKNLIAAKKDNPVSARFCMEQLQKFADITKPAFDKMIAIWDLGEDEKACQYFVTTLGFEVGESSIVQEIASIFVKLDQLDPIKLKSQLDTYQEVFKRERETKKLKETETKSYIVYSIVFVSAFIIILNFIVIVYLIDAMNMFNFL